jgi:ankyrin repeat protein
MARFFFTLLLPMLSFAEEMTPWDKDLLNAAGEGDLDTVKSFLKSGASVNARSEYGETPLHVAAIKCNLDVVEVLIAAGADVNAKTNSGSPQGANFLNSRFKN